MHHTSHMCFSTQATTYPGLTCALRGAEERYIYKMEYTLSFRQLLILIEQTTLHSQAQTWMNTAVLLHKRRKIHLQ